MAQGAEVKATCPLQGEGNRSQARQAHHQVPGGKEEGRLLIPTGGTPPLIPTGGPGQQSEPLDPTLSLPRVSGRDGHVRAACGGLMEMPSDPKSQGPS